MAIHSVEAKKVTMNQRCQRGRIQLGTVQYSRRPRGHVITHFTCAQQPPAGGGRVGDTQVRLSNLMFVNHCAAAHQCTVR